MLESNDVQAAREAYRIMGRSVQRYYAICSEIAEASYGGDEEIAWEAMPQVWRDGYAALNEIRLRARADYYNARHAGDAR